MISVLGREQMRWKLIEANAKPMRLIQADVSIIWPAGGETIGRPASSRSNGLRASRTAGQPAGGRAGAINLVSRECQWRRLSGSPAPELADRDVSGERAKWTRRAQWVRRRFNQAPGSALTCEWPLLTARRIHRSFAARPPSSWPAGRPGWRRRRDCGLSALAAHSGGRRPRGPSGGPGERSGPL